MEAESPGDGWSHKLKKGDSSCNLPLQDVELMYGSTHLNVDIPSGNVFKVVVGWDFFRGI